MGEPYRAARMRHLRRMPDFPRRSARAGLRPSLVLAIVMAGALGASLFVQNRNATSAARPADAPVSVVDGDSLRAGGREIRLSGIDAPELAQTCRDASGREWACGRAARSRLEALVAQGVTCADRGQDRYGRTLAVCSAQGIDIGAALVREGLAVNFMTGGYAAQEDAARAEARGIWSGAFERPEQWRRRHPRSG